MERNSGGVPWWMEVETFRETSISELDPGKKKFVGEMCRLFVLLRPLLREATKVLS